MNTHQRRRHLLTSLGALVLAVLALPGLLASPLVRSAAQSGQPALDALPPLPSANVPLVHLSPGTPGQVAARSAQASLAPDTIHWVDMDQQGIEPVADLSSAQREAARGTTSPVAGFGAPLGGAIGYDNAFLSISPDAARPSTVAAVGTIATGFKPYEIVIYTFSGQNTYYVQANADGAAFVGVNTGSSSGYAWIRAQGLTSGKVTGGVIQITPNAPPVPGLAVGPHAVRPGDRLYMYGVRYTAGTSLSIARNNTVLTNVPVDTFGTTPLIQVTVGAGQDGAAVYNSFTAINPAGSMAGQSIEERADAGPIHVPVGDRNITRAFIDRPVLSSTVTTTLGLTGEGFQPGETVNVIRTPGSLIGSATADSTGAVAFLAQTPPSANLYSVLFQGVSSGRMGYGALLADSRAINVPTTIVAPNHGTGSGTISVLFTRFGANQSGAILRDGAVVGGVNTSPEGYGSVVLAKPSAGELIHSYAFSESLGINIAAGPVVLAHSGTIVGTVHDAVSGLPIKATLRLGSQAVVQSDPTNSGNYSTTVPVGSYSMSVTGSGCYVPQNINVTVTHDTVTTYNVVLTRSGIDAVGYSCYDNAGRAYTPAQTRVFANTFNDEAANYTLPFPISFYNRTVTTGTLSANGFVTVGNQFACPQNNCYPANSTIPQVGPPNGFVAANWDDLIGLSDDAASGVFTDVIGTAPNRTFLVEWRDYANAHDSTSISNTVQLQIDEAGSNFYLVYPTYNIGASDGREGTIGSESHDGLTGKNYQSNTSTGAVGEVTNYVWPGNSVRIWQSGNPTATPTRTITPTPTWTPTARTPTITPTATPETCRTDGNYVQMVATGVALDPGTVDIGNHGDNVNTTVALPFAYTFYGLPYTSANVSSNGTIQFSSSTVPSANACLPSATLNNAIAAYWDDLRTDGAGGVGIFTSTTGAAPNRIFNIEWRACVFASAGCSSADTNFEVRLYENTQRLELVYGQMLQNGNGATVGVQKATGAQSRLYACNAPNLASGLRVTYIQVPCATPTVTKTPTITPTPSKTPTRTPFPTIVQGSPTVPPICDSQHASFNVALNGQNVVPSNGSTAIGQGTFSLLLTNNTISYNVTYQGLVATETGADLSVGAPGTNGTAFYTLPLGTPKNGSFTFPTDKLAALYAGNIYLTIRSTAFPGGEIRGQLITQCGTPVATQTPGGPTATPGGPTQTPGGPTATPVVCNITFSDVPAGVYFYTPVQYLYCQGILSGYSDNTFRPYSNTSRGQMVKIVVGGFHVPAYTPPNGTPTFADVPASYVFYPFIEAAAHAAIVTGYTCGGVNEPCDTARRPYFRPGADVSRGQLAKITVIAAGWALINPTRGSFADVATTSVFYKYVETAACRTIVSGYTCGSSSGEPCDSTRRPYFRPVNSAARAQIAKIVYLGLTNTAPCIAPTPVP
ncbi:MAG: S-layer homology domain-containing protein [Chloroflexota bacterium]|nr:S-layer homology domain-containing protein [Chloroflexota bacterium]